MEKIDLKKASKAGEKNWTVTVINDQILSRLHNK